MYLFPPVAAGNFYPAAGWPGAGAANSSAALTFPLLVAAGPPAAAPWPGSWLLSATGPDITGLLEAGAPSPQRPWPSPPSPPVPRTNKTLWSQNETKHWQSVSFPLASAAFSFIGCLPFEMLQSSEGRRGCGCAKEPFGNVSFHVSEPGQPANQMPSGRLCRSPMGAVHKGVISISSLRGPAQCVRALPHTSAHSIRSCHLIKGPLTSRRKRGAATLEGVEEAINQGFPA